MTAVKGFRPEINFRDLGGYTAIDGRAVRNGLLYRSSAPGLMNEEELNLLSRLYFCESDEDLWDVLLDGYGEPQYFLKGYAGMREGILPEYGRFPDALRTADDERLRRFVVYMTSHNPLIFYGTGGLKD